MQQILANQLNSMQSSILKAATSLNEQPDKIKEAILHQLMNKRDSNSSKYGIVSNIIDSNQPIILVTNKY